MSGDELAYQAMKLARAEALGDGVSRDDLRDRIESDDEYCRILMARARAGDRA